MLMYMNKQSEQTVYVNNNEIKKNNKKIENTCSSVLSTDCKKEAPICTFCRIISKIIIIIIKGTKAQQNEGAEKISLSRQLLFE